MSNTIQSSLNWATAYLGYSVPAVGPNNEPAITAANMTQQVMLAPPFRWAWNRNSFVINTIIGVQDYVVTTATDFGYLEIADISLADNSKAETISILNHTPLGGSVSTQQPNKITVQVINIGVNMDFRFICRPNNVYGVGIYYQKAAPLMTALTSAWTPPDYMSYVYNRGFLAHCMEAKGDPRAQQEKINFAAALLGTAEGLTETERNIFLAQYLPNTRDLQFAQLKAQQGVQARGQ